MTVCASMKHIWWFNFSLYKHWEWRFSTASIKMPSLHLLTRTLSDSERISEKLEFLDLFNFSLYLYFQLLILIFVVDASHYDMFPQSTFFKRYFFDNLGKLSPSGAGDRSDYRFNDVLRRRFLRQGRLCL